MIGYVVHAPAIAVDDGAGHFTRDWALIDLYRDKIDWDTFQGNNVFVGTFPSYLGNTVPGFSVYFLYSGGKISPADFTVKMHPHPQGQSDLKYPPCGFSSGQRVCKERPDLQAAAARCQRREVSGCRQERKDYWHHSRSPHRYGVIHPQLPRVRYQEDAYSNKYGALFFPGDSGSIFVDSKGRIVVLLVGGASTTEETDVTYVTPYWWIEEQMKIAYPKIALYEVVGQVRRLDLF